MIQFVKKKRKNDSKLDDFLYISVNELERFKSLPSMTESLPGSKIAKHKSPRAKERASGSRARSKIRPEDYTTYHCYIRCCCCCFWCCRCCCFCCCCCCCCRLRVIVKTNLQSQHFRLLSCITRHQTLVSFLNRLNSKFQSSLTI